MLDVENLNARPRFSACDITVLRTRYCRAVGLAPSAHVVLGTSAGPAALEAGLGWGGTRVLFREGKDGADLALLQVLLTEDIVGRYERVVIGSGDHAFAPAARYLHNAGLHVTVVAANRRSLSNALLKQADRTVLLDLTVAHTPAGDAA